MSTVSFAWIFAFILLQRLNEVITSHFNYKKLQPQVARVFHSESYRNIAVMHALFFVVLAWESYPWQLSLNVQTYVCLAIVVGLALFRLWCMASLRPYWNVRIIVVPGAHVKQRGPYRWMRHPNYLVVILEFIFIPLLMRAPLTLVLFSILNLFALRQRIRFEEQALRKYTDYEKVFGEKATL